MKQNPTLEAVKRNPLPTKVWIGILLAVLIPLCVWAESSCPTCTEVQAEGTITCPDGGCENTAYDPYMMDCIEPNDQSFECLSHSESTWIATETSSASGACGDCLGRMVYDPALDCGFDHNQCYTDDTGCGGNG